MLVKDIINKNVVSVSAQDTISSALAKMKQHKVHQLPVVDGELKGMLVLKRIVTKDIPLTTKVESLMLPSAVLAPDMDIVKASEKLLLSGMRALPVVNNEKIIGMLSETDILGAIEKLETNPSIREIMSECDYVSVHDDVGKVKKIMVYKNVSRVPVVDAGRLAGVVGTMDLIDIVLRKEPMRGGGRMLIEKGEKESMSIDKTPVTCVMEEVTTVDKDIDVREAASILAKKEEVFAEDNGMFYVVTPKDVIELIASSGRKGLYVQITNLGDVDAMTNAKIEKKIAEFVKKMGRMINNIQSFVIHVERHEKQGKKTKYSVRTRFLVPMGLFVSRSWGWSLLTAFQDAINNLEREILKKHGRLAKHEREKKSKMARE